MNCPVCGHNLYRNTEANRKLSFCPNCGYKNYNFNGNIVSNEMNTEKIKKILKEEKGKQFDPAIADIVLKNFDNMKSIYKLLLLWVVEKEFLRRSENLKDTKKRIRELKDEIEKIEEKLGGYESLEKPIEESKEDIESKIQELEKLKM